MLLSLHPRLYLYLFLYMHQYLLSDDDHDDDHEAYRLHDDEDDDDAEIYFIGQCCEPDVSLPLLELGGHDVRSSRLLVGGQHHH